ncbi:MAG: hypothetical protein LKE64_06135 [Solobacterium sp.]|jgi:hypothetical protein|nr:hypothetical protein [Solobacterium sp.]MCH4049195.1 hypothetical protein [Solobacterium sp.]MCH4074051.1 hypothetical protein [Solobacterium sp.]MCI1314777.1 hypothetical protein [Solobacterium sp.]MCI1347201.1 hypothetical protein [Solobacterium sp.]
MKKISKFLAVSAAACVLSAGLCVKAPEVHASAGVDMYRLYNPNTGEHFYTSSVSEREHLRSVGWKYEQIGWVAPEKSNTPVYRLYNAAGSEHHYTYSAAERDMLVSKGWKYEQIGWYSDDDKTVPLYRQYNPHAFSCNHNYTISKAENDMLVSKGWTAEDIGWYGIEGGRQDPDADTNKAVPSGEVASTQVDVNVTGAGGAEENNPGSYRLEYSNKPFDSASLSGVTPTVEYKGSVQMNGQTDDYGVQFVIGGHGDASGQIGAELHYQAGNDARFGQGRINVTTINFPAYAGTHGEQYYVVNTSAPAINAGDTVALDVKYFADQGMMQSYVNGTLVGQYKTTLATADGFYIPHTLMEGGTCSVTNMQVYINGKDVTDKGAPSFSSVNTVLGSGQNTSGAFR